MPSRLMDVAQEVLDAVVAAFAGAAIDLPARQFVSNNGVAYDCEQVSVEVGGLSTGSATADRVGSLRVPVRKVATILVALIRDCQPMSSEEGNPPDVETIEAASDQLLADASVLISVFKKSTLASCEDTSVQSCVPYGPEGGVAGWVLTIRTAL